MATKPNLVNVSTKDGETRGNHATSGTSPAASNSGIIVDSAATGNVAGNYTSGTSANLDKWKVSTKDGPSQITVPGNPTQPTVGTSNVKPNLPAVDGVVATTGDGVKGLDYWDKYYGTQDVSKWVTGGDDDDPPPTDPPADPTSPANPTTPTQTNTAAALENAWAAEQLTQATQPSQELSAPTQAETPQAPDLTSLLEEWKTAALEQSNGQIDYSVAQAIIELERALEDAQPQYKEQAESVALDERQGMDNSALYAEMRGDKGGIGQSQYNEIQAAAAQNRLAVQQAQTKLSTDTARQIADLRAQGEFEKADKALEISQQYLSQLVSLEQWAAEYNLTAAQFEEAKAEWLAEYELAMKELDIGVDQWERQFAQDQQNTATDLYLSLLSAGIPVDENQLAAMGGTITADQAAELAMLGRLSQYSGGNDSGGDDTTPTLYSINDAVYKNAAAMLENGQSDEAIYNYLTGVSPDGAATYAGFLGLEIPGVTGPSEDSVRYTYKWQQSPTNGMPTSPELVGTDGTISENTLAWAKKVLANNNSDPDALAKAMEDRGFAADDIIKILTGLGFEVTVN